MVLENLFKINTVRHRPYLAFFLGFIFTFISFLIANLFFRSSTSFVLIFILTLLLTPTFAVLLRIEENIERKYGLRHFFRNHKDIFEIYLFSFLGVFLAFVILGLAFLNNSELYNSLFSFQTKFIQTERQITPDVVHNFVQNPLQPTILDMFHILSNNLLLVVICFLLSFLCGASSIFLLTLNGSIFSNFIVFVIRTITENIFQGIQALLFFSIHMIPEMAGILLSAIAGGVVSKAVMREKKSSAALRNVFKDATLLVLFSVLLVFLGAFLEVYVTSTLFKMFF